ncbi:MlaD family protein [Williamsia soli]|uniref:MlaD family protein n=1 Tax=Williamsia soli TaxID=364929 RepID=UPI001A9F0339|nr:MCE family protein [Williamsia soli]
MPVIFDTDPRGNSNTRLFIFGLTALAVVALLLVALYAKMNGTFDKTVTATAVLANVGDGLPSNSDVKYRGVLVGTVKGVDPGTNGGLNYVDLALDPSYTRTIPRTVTARVVPSNVFAVSSIQLVDNGSAPGLTQGAIIAQDESLSTVQLQTAMTKVREIIAASARVGTDETVGMLAVVAEATDRHGDDIATAGAQLDKITRELDAVIAPRGQPSTLSALSEAVQGLRKSAPDLLDVMNSAVVPMRTLAEKNKGLNQLLAAGTNTLSTVDTALNNNTDKIIGITTALGPVIEVMADGGGSFTQITTSLNNVSKQWFAEFWPVGQQNGTGKFQFQFTPHQMYTRADCPRYGNLEGPSCQTAPVTNAPAVMPDLNTPQNFMSAPMGGNVGPVGSREEQRLLGEILGEDANSASTLLLGPLARGAVVSASAEPEQGQS